VRGAIARHPVEWEHVVVSATRPVGTGSTGTGLEDGSAADVVRAVATPAWLGDLGRSAWLLVGVGILLAGVFYALAEATEIVGPLVAGGVVATVAAPLVSRLQRHRVRRAWGALIVLLALTALAVVVMLLVLQGLVGEANTISKNAAAAADKIESGLKSSGAGASASKDVKSALESAAPQLVKGLANGLVGGVQSVASLALGVSFTLFSIFFLLKDGPALRRVVERHLGVPLPVGRVVVGRLVISIRGYFLGVTIVAVFNGVVVGLGAWILGVPLAATIGVVTFALAYIPFIGAFVAGAFAVLIALGANGTGTAVAMLVVVLLANGLLQNIVSPFAMGAALDMNPLLNLAVTVGAGCLFGMFGLVLAAPLTSAAMHIGRDLRELDAPRTAGADGSAAPAPEPGG
jgi:predicted PurR-regulated permease PerM